MAQSDAIDIISIVLYIILAACLAISVADISRVDKAMSSLERRVDGMEKALKEKTCNKEQTTMRTTPLFSGGIYGTGVPINTAPDHERTDRERDFGWKSDQLGRLVDTACVAPGHYFWACEAYYRARMPCVRGIAIWSAMARAANWSYDPWEMVAPNVTLDRLGKWVRHPGSYYQPCV